LSVVHSHALRHGGNQVCSRNHINSHTVKRHCKGNPSLLFARSKSGRSPSSSVTYVAKKRLKSNVVFARHRLLPESARGVYRIASRKDTNSHLDEVDFVAPISELGARSAFFATVPIDVF
jgi:hypothetical protein